MKVALIGGCGFIGSHICDRLLERGFEIRIIGRCKHKKQKNIKHILSNEAVEFAQADVRSFESIEKAIKNCDVIMHYAALINVDESIQNPRLFYDVNVFGTFNVLEIARKGNTPLIYKSTCEVFGHIPYPYKAHEDYPPNPRSPYAVSKLCAERYCLAYQLTYDLPIVISRGFNTFGPRQGAGKFGAVIPKFITRVLDDKPPVIFGDGLQTRDYVYVKDIAEADVMILEALIDGRIPGGEVFNVCTGIDKSIRDIAYEIIKLRETKNVLEPVFVDVRPGEVRRSIGTFKKIKQKLGWQPRTSFTEGLRHTMEFFHARQ